MKRMTKEEKQYVDYVVSLGCIICGSPANAHHPRFACGMSQRSPHWLVIPLCKYHHQDGPCGEALHNGQQEFQKKFGREEDLLAEVIRRNYFRTVPF